VDDGLWREFTGFLAGRPDFPKYLADYKLTYSDSLVTANADYIRRGIRRELMRHEFGAQAAYLVSIHDDFQLQQVRQLFGRAHDLKGLYAIAARLHGQKVDLEHPLDALLDAKR